MSTYRVELLGPTPATAYGVGALLWEELGICLSTEFNAADLTILWLEPHFIDLQVRERARALPVISVLPSRDDLMVREAIAAGSLGCIAHDGALDSMLAAVSAAIDGQRFICPSLAVMLATADEIPMREREVLRELALGYSNQEVAELLHLSVRTIESHRAMLQRRLGVTKRWELVAAARERGMI